MNDLEIVKETSFSTAGQTDQKSGHLVTWTFLCCRNFTGRGKEARKKKKGQLLSNIVHLLFFSAYTVNQVYEAHRANNCDLLMVDLNGWQRSQWMNWLSLDLSFDNGRHFLYNVKECKSSCFSIYIFFFFFPPPVHFGLFFGVFLSTPWS